MTKANLPVRGGRLEFGTACFRDRRGSQESSWLRELPLTSSASWLPFDRWDFLLVISNARPDDYRDLSSMPAWPYVRFADAARKTVRLGAYSDVCAPPDRP